MKQITRSSVAVIVAIASIVLSASPFGAAVNCAPIKVTVDGEGYLRLSREGRAVYTKTATLTVAANGKLATTSGDAVLPTIAAPIVSQSLQVDLEGNVFALRNGDKAKIGRLVLALFPEGTALDEKNGVLLSTERPKLGDPGDDTNGVIRSETVPTIESKTSSPIEPKATNEPKPATQPIKPTEQPVETKPTPKGDPAKPKISAVSTAEVSGETVTLGDIAVVEGEPTRQQFLKNIEIGGAPALGAKRFFDRAQIIGKIKLAAVKEEDIELLIPATITVTRKSQTITHSEFVQAALRAVYESPGIVTEYIADSAGSEFLAPVGPRAFMVETISGLNTAVATIKIAVYVGTKRINSRTLTLKAKALQE